MVFGVKTASVKKQKHDNPPPPYQEKMKIKSTCLAPSRRKQQEKKTPRWNFREVFVCDTTKGHWRRLWLGTLVKKPCEDWQRWVSIFYSIFFNISLNPEVRMVDRKREKLHDIDNVPAAAEHWSQFYSQKTPRRLRVNMRENTSRNMITIT